VFLFKSSVGLEQSSEVALDFVGSAWPLAYLSAKIYLDNAQIGICQAP
jgi:hypothetical protein